MPFIVNKVNLLGFFQRRPNGATPELIEDTAGLGSLTARRMLQELVREGAIEFRHGLYFPAGLT